MKRILQRTAQLALGALAAIFPLAAVAAEEAEGASPFAGDVGNAIWTVVIFLLVVWVLGKFAWGPMLRGLQGREDFIRRNLQQARADREAAEARLKEYEERLAAARAEATAIVEEGRRDAEVVKTRIEEDARKEAERMIDRARREIGIAKETAVKELYTLTGRLATQVASRIIAKELSPADHERLIAESIERLESAQQN